METIKIECQPNVRTKILEFLSSFSEKECKVVTEDSSFIENKRKLHLVDAKISNGTAEFCSFEELDSYLDNVISNHED
ncbi:MAG: hypothetical protein O9267_02510 [Flavobacterium sp.]|jgi:hypothetical protein|uniref:hypothetical protein n=1 Tax=Flavobacterium sp. TaxID=239 RepID=UPI0022C3FD58|nr:hypothetical protein [Flavobacterium sp.]MCZ8196464.1 hypothetical protein [Flavobacterium sp.]